MADLRWPTVADAQLRDDVHVLMRAVVALGGAIGYLTDPTRAESDDLLDHMLASGDLCCAYDDEGLAAMGLLARRPFVIHEHGREVQKVMTHPRTRGQGLARRVCAALVDRARADGVEHVLLSVRHNNVRAQRIYTDLGFVEVGRFPGTIAVGDLRFDSVWMQLDLGYADGVELWGDRPGGPGS